jgi:hypothetical protein
MEDKDDYEHDGREPRFNDLNSILASERRPLYLTAHAGLGWTRTEAFRELIQNWYCHDT